MSLRTVRSWVAGGKIPCYRIGRSVFFKWEDVDQVLESNRVEPWNCVGTFEDAFISSNDTYERLKEMLAHDIQTSEPTEASWQKPSRYDYQLDSDVGDGVRV